MFAGELVCSLTPLTNKTANISAMFALVIRKRSSLILALVIRQRMFAHVRWRTCSFTNATNEQLTANISAMFALVIRKRSSLILAFVIQQRMFAHVCWRTCSFTNAANKQNSKHIRYVRSCYSAAKFAHVRTCYSEVNVCS